jgi:hypothetical protein
MLRKFLFILALLPLNGLAAEIGGGNSKFTMTQFYIAYMPVYSTLDDLGSGGWHEHHFCICNVSTQSKTTHFINWRWVNTSGATMVDSGSTSVVGEIELAPVSGAGLMGSVSTSTNIKLKRGEALEAKSLAAQSYGSGDYESASMKPSFWVNEATGKGGKENFAYVWYFLAENASKMSSEAGQGVSPIATTYGPLKVSATASSMNTLNVALGTCNYSTQFEWASDSRNNCGDHPVGSLILHVPSEHQGGVYYTNFKIFTTQNVSTS